MEYRRFADDYVLRLDRGEEIVASLTEFCEKESVRLGSIQGLGAADHAVIGLYDVAEKQYHKKSLDFPMEITSLIGNISTKDGQTYLHIHINLCDEEMKVFGGHLNECRISATCELYIHRVEGSVERLLDTAVTGLNLYRF